MHSNSDLTGGGQVSMSVCSVHASRHTHPSPTQLHASPHTHVIMLYLSIYCSPFQAHQPLSMFTLEIGVNTIYVENVNKRFFFQEIFSSYSYSFIFLLPLIITDGFIDVFLNNQVFAMVITMCIHLI